MPANLRPYLLAEALRLTEEAAGEPLRDAGVEARAIRAGADLPSRILARAGLLAARLDLDEPLDRAMLGFRRASLALAGLGLLAGFGAARALPQGQPAEANVTVLLAVLILPNALSLLLWLLGTAWMLLGRRDAAGGWIGRRALDLLDLVDRLRGQATAAHSPVRRAWREFLYASGPGHHRLLLTSHLFWTALLGGALAGCWWLLLLRQVDFAWGTTLLSAASMRDLLGTLTGWVGLLGLPVPDNADILASRVGLPVADPELRRRWGLFILGAIVLFGLLPRLLAAGVDALALRAGLARLQPSTGRPGYARLQPLLLPVTHAGSRPGGPLAAAPARPVPPPGDASPPPAQAAWVALERPPAAAIEPAAPAADLGIISTREDERQLLERLAGEQPWPALCVSVDLASSPDRGLGRALADIVRASRVPVHLVLTGSAAWTALPAEAAATRLSDWQTLAAEAGIEAGRQHDLTPVPGR